MSSFLVRPSHLIGGLVVFSLLMLVIGCGPSGPANLVKGKVTLKDAPVSGTITFIGPGNVEKSGPIMPDGSYAVGDPATGLNKIKIASMGALLAAPNPPVMDKKGEKALNEGVKQGVPAPKKYESPDNGLTYEVKAGIQSKDFPLEP